MTSMVMTTLGASGLPASRIGLGLAALGRPGYINLGHSADLANGRAVEALRDQASTVLDVAWSLRVRYFDAARSYGQAESFLDHWLVSRKIAPGSLTIGSKWGYTYTADWKVEADKHEVKDHSITTLRRQVIETRQTLGTYVNLYQIHSATLESGVLDDRGVLEELGRIRDELGWKIGLSISGPRQGEALGKAIGIEVGGRLLFGVVQATWNLLEPSVGPALQSAHDAGLGVIVKEALANGRLTDRNRDSEFETRRRSIEAEAKRLETTIDALAIAAALAQPWADVVLSGASTIEQLRSNREALNIPWDESAEAALQNMREPPEAYWSNRSRLPWN